jgi:putative transposase
MITGAEQLSIGRPCALLGLRRASGYYTPRPGNEIDLTLMRRLDALHLEPPFRGARKLAKLLHEAGHPVARRPVRTLMRRMGMQTLYRKPRTRQPAQGASVFPDLRARLAMARAKQVWAAAITYLPMARGFVYRVAILEIASRKVLAWRLSNTLTAEFCVEALAAALARYGTAEIFNTDQGAQFTSAAFPSVLNTAGVSISMDGKGRWIDTVFIERL